MTEPQTARKPTAANRLGFDYAAEAATFPRRANPIIDVHSHIGGDEAAQIYKRAAELYGIGLTYSMTHLEELDRGIIGLGDLQCIVDD